MAVCLSVSHTHRQLILGRRTRLCKLLFLTVLFGGPDIVWFIVVSYCNHFPCFGAKFSLSACTCPKCACFQKGAMTLTCWGKPVHDVWLQKKNVKSDPHLQMCHVWVWKASNTYCMQKSFRCECVAFISQSAVVHNCIFLVLSSEWML